MEARGQVNVARRQLLSDDKPESPNLRDYLRIRQEENSNESDNSGRVTSPGLTLSSVLKSEDRNGHPLRSQSNRTLLDVIREDPNGGGDTKDARRSWRHFREKIRLRRQGSGSSWTSAVPVPASDVPIQPSSSNVNRMSMMTRRDSTRRNMGIAAEGSAQPDVDLNSGVPRSRSSMMQRNDSRALSRASGRFDNVRGFDDDHDGGERQTVTERVRVRFADELEDESEEEEEGEGETPEEGGGGQRMSLMALLAETDKQMGLDGSSYMMDDDEDDDDDDDEEDEKGGDVAGSGYNNCCVCMVRHKGAAFIPCGHTFCRLCSRELWVQRGNCPLCNNFILEILDIF